MRFGILPDMGATVRLPRIVGESRARELVLLGDLIDADEALRIGLANRVVADTDLDAATAELAGRLSAQPPIAVRAPGGRSTGRGTAGPRTASPSSSRSRSAASGPGTSPGVSGDGRWPQSAVAGPLHSHVAVGGVCPYGRPSKQRLVS
jgi:hypothetical protein